MGQIAMISPQDLRIGNWVHAGVYYKIKASDFVNTDFNKTNPIPLSPEILEKIEGVDVTPTDALLMPIYLIKDFPGYRVHLSDKKRENGIDLEEQIYYAHQLQNLFYCLSGQELEINL